MYVMRVVYGWGAGGIMETDPKDKKNNTHCYVTLKSSVSINGIDE